MIAEVTSRLIAADLAHVRVERSNRNQVCSLFVANLLACLRCGRFRRSGVVPPRAGRIVPPLPSMCH